jgi:hypothetical protein
VIISIFSALWIFFEVRGSFSPAVQFFDEAANQLVANEPEIVCARAQLRARRVYFTALIGLPDEGLRMAQESVNILSQYNQQDITVDTYMCVALNASVLNRDQILFKSRYAGACRAKRGSLGTRLGIGLVVIRAPFKATNR